jgi:hypothetical protein
MTLHKTLQRASTKARPTKGSAVKDEQFDTNTKYMSNEFLRARHYSKHEDMILRTLEDIKSKCILRTDADELPTSQRKQLAKGQRKVQKPS